MSFAWPWALSFAVLVFLAVVGLILLRRRRGNEGGLPYSDLDLITATGVAPRRRRHIPMFLAVAGLIVLSVGIARPEAERDVPRDRATVMMAIDVSGSMAATDVYPTRLRAAQDAARTFANEMPRTFQVGLVSFSGNATVIVPPTTDREELRRGIDSLSAYGGTAIGEALVTSLEAIRQAQGGAAVPDAARILLLSDGANTHGISVERAVADVREAEVPVYTVALGTPDGRLFNGQRVAPSPEALQNVAESTGGESFVSEDAGSLEDVYAHLGSFIGTTRETREITDRVVLIAGILFLAAGAAWWRWGVRLG